MIKRVIDISERAYLHIKDRQLCVDKDHSTVSKIAVEDLGILITAAPCDNHYTVDYYPVSAE